MWPKYAKLWQRLQIFLNMQNMGNIFNNFNLATFVLRNSKILCFCESKISTVTNFELERKKVLILCEIQYYCLQKFSQNLA